jgi:hypothetical protein
MPKNSKKLKKGKNIKTRTKKHNGGEYNPHNMFLGPNDVSDYTIKTPGINDDYHKIGMAKSSDSSSAMYLGGAVAVVGLGVGGYFLFKK